MVLSMELAQSVVIPTVKLAIMVSALTALPTITQVAVNVSSVLMATIHQLVIANAQFALLDAPNVLMKAHALLAQPTTICHQTPALPVVMAKFPLLAQLHAHLAVTPTVKLVA